MASWHWFTKYINVLVKGAVPLIVYRGMGKWIICVVAHCILYSLVSLAKDLFRNGRWNFSPILWNYNLERTPGVLFVAPKWKLPIWSVPSISSEILGLNRVNWVSQGPLDNLTDYSINHMIQHLQRPYLGTLFSQIRVFRPILQRSLV